jgi:hypothetical protein
MKLRNFLLCAAMTSLTTGVYALEWQVDSLTNLELANTPSPPTNIEEELLGSVKIPLDANGSTFESSAHGWVGYPSTGAADFDTLNFNFVYQHVTAEIKTLKWTLGRYQLTEPTGLIVNQPIDGSNLDFDFGTFDLKIATGYSGLVMRSTTNLIMSEADQQSEAWLGSPRFFGSVESSVPLPAGHTLTFNALAQQDMTPTSKLISEWSTTQQTDKGGRVDTQYLTLKADGPLADKLFYSAFATFEAGSTLSLLTVSTGNYLYQYEPITALLGGLEATWYIPSLMSAAFSARALFASGDGDYASAIEGNTKGNATMFIPVNVTTLGTVFNPALSNLGYYELNGSVKPIDGQQFVVGSKLLGFHRLVAGVVNATGVLSNGPIWMGEELDLYSSWQPYSDLSLTASVGAFLPTSGTYDSSTTGSGFQYALTTGFNLSL